MFNVWIPVNTPAVGPSCLKFKRRKGDDGTYPLTYLYIVVNYHAYTIYSHRGPLANAEGLFSCQWERETDMINKRRCNQDRRSGSDRRKVYDLDYFMNGGVERRAFKERRSGSERRAQWKMISEWSSIAEHNRVTIYQVA